MACRSSMKLFFVSLMLGGMSTDTGRSLLPKDGLVDGRLIAYLSVVSLSPSAARFAATNRFLFALQLIAVRCGSELACGTTC